MPFPFRAKSSRAWRLITVFVVITAHSIYAEDKINYLEHVLPLIETHCAKCHNGDKKKGDLDLTSYNGAMKGGGSGVAVVAANPEGSKLFRAVTHAEEPTMPPNKGRLPDKELDVFKRWIAGGLLENSGSKAAAARPAVDLAVKVTTLGKPDGPPTMPGNLPQEPVLRPQRGSAVVGLASSPWAPVLAVGAPKQILLFHAETLKLLGALPFPEGQPVDLKFSRNGKLLIAGGGHGGKSGKVALWDLANGQRLATIGNEYDAILASDISPDQAEVALGGPGRLVKIFSTKTGELLHKLKRHTDWVTAIAFSPNGETLATADRNGGIVMWDADSGQEMFSLAGHKASVTALQWRGDGKFLASASEDGAIKLWEPSEGKQFKTWNAHAGGALCVSFTHDGRMVSCGRDNQLMLWDANGNKLRALEFPGELPVRTVFSHDGSRVVAGDWNGKVRVWNTDDKKSIGELSLGPAAKSVVVAEQRTDSRVH